MYVLESLRNLSLAHSQGKRTNDSFLFEISPYKITTPSEHLKRLSTFKFKCIAVIGFKHFKCTLIMWYNRLESLIKKHLVCILLLKNNKFSEIQLKMN